MSGAGVGTDAELRAALRLALTDVGAFSRLALPTLALRGYQTPLARAVADSVVAGEGREYAAIFSRQSGKDELLAQLLTWLLCRQRLRGGTAIVATPALRPQGIITRDRLVERLATPFVRAIAGPVRLRDGNTVQLGRARVRFLSAARGANSRGNTADLLLVANEAQDIDPDVWDAVFAPMAASSDATTLYLGTVWSSVTLLARQLRLLRELERSDGVERVYRVPWRRVAEELPAYGAYVRRQMALLGEQHPFIRTEYELEELDGGGRLFPPERQALLRGSFPPLAGPPPDDAPGVTYAFVIDVAGEEEDGLEGEAARRRQPQRDSTALGVVRVVPGAGLDARPTFQLVARYLWTGTRHTTLHERIAQLATRVWRARRVVIDATGVGAGLASFLSATLGERIVVPFVFSSTSKSQLAWDLLALIDAGRLCVCAPEHGSDAEQTRLDQLFWRQLDACRYTVLPGPGKLLRWGVEDAHLHDDLLFALALTAVLNRQDWRSRDAHGRNTSTTQGLALH